jgi:hypothetical protein
MKIFLSSTYQDLSGYRDTAARAIERLGQHGVRMEVFGARPLETTEACFEEISDADALVGILRDLGLNVQVETSSEDALRALASHAYNAVISDMQRARSMTRASNFSGGCGIKASLFP